MEKPLIGTIAGELTRLEELTATLKTVVAEVEQHAEDKKIKATGIVVIGLLKMTPYIYPFFAKEGKSLSGCVAYIEEKFGDGWLEVTNDDELNAINDAMFDYYEITDEALSAMDL